MIDQISSESIEEGVIRLVIDQIAINPHLKDQTKTHLRERTTMIIDNSQKITTEIDTKLLKDHKMVTNNPGIAIRKEIEEDLVRVIDTKLLTIGVLVLVLALARDTTIEEPKL